MDINHWAKTGRISIWRYEPVNRNFPGWHMTADKLGYESLKNLIQCFKESSAGTKRTITLDKPDRNLASTKLAKTVEAKVVIELSSKENDWHLKNEGPKLKINIGLAKLGELLSGIQRAQSGSYDFSVGGLKGQNLWFW